MLFTRGVVFTFAEQKRAALKALLAAHALGDPRARRWLAVHGKAVPAVKKTAQKLTKKPETKPNEAMRVIEKTRLRRVLATVKFDQAGNYKDPAKALPLVEALQSGGWFVGHEIRALVGAARHMAKLPKATRAAILKLGEQMVMSDLSAPPRSIYADDIPAEIAVELAAMAAAAGDKDGAFTRLEQASLLGADVAALGEEVPFNALREDPAFVRFFPTPEESAALLAVKNLKVEVVSEVRRFADPARALKLLEPLSKSRWVAASLSTLICAALAPETKPAVRAGIKRVATTFVDAHADIRDHRKRHVLHYTAHCLACLDATMGDAAQAIAHLKTARALGYDISGAPKDPDFASVLTNPEFKALFT